MKKIAQYVNVLLFVAVALIAALPILHVTSRGKWLPWLSDSTIASFNFIGWALVAVILFSREEMRKTAAALAQKMGLDPQFDALEALLQRTVREIERKLELFTLSLMEKRISSKDQLTQSLEGVVSLAYRLFDAESVELALLDEESGLYHSSIVLGKPFSSGAQAMLAQAAQGREYAPSPDVVVQPIAFAGSILGSLRIGLRRGRVPSSADREIARLLALHGGLAIINAQYTQELVRMKRSSDESVKAKTGFLANLSHEIRGPLGIMLNAAELVLDGLCGELTNDQRDTLRMIKSNGAHLLELINDVLDYAKIESGKITPEKTDILVQDLLDDIASVVRTQAESKHHKLVVQRGPEAFAFACDRRHARQMLINLLTNAIKYTPDGGAITVWAERKAANKIRICVQDTGVGIDASDRHKVFAAFERIEHSYSLQQVGTGLGMPLTKRLCEVNGGSIDFDSVPGKGSTFWLQFPSIQVTPFITKEKEQEEPTAQGGGEAILVMESEEGERAMMLRYLNHIGFACKTAATKTDVMRVFQGAKPRVALIDNTILEVDEPDLIQMLRSLSPEIKIVVVSSRAFVFDVEKYLKAGVDRCVSKPLSLKSLGVAIRELLDADIAQPKKSQKIPAGRKIPDEFFH